MTPIKVNQVAKAVVNLAKENREHWKTEVRTMHCLPDVTSSSKSVTVNGYIITITIEREEEEL